MNNYYEQILAHIADKPGLTCAELAQHTKCSQGLVNRALYRIKQHRWVTHKGTPAKYEITDKGLEAFVTNHPSPLEKP
ncbi:MAG: MarR family transcriptional regulator [Candidatus Hermodarchaeia archaeon]|jgi:DNA-binding IclR family transcriptional regulator